ncbi:MAG: PhzF family phenazine biosynthesis protein [Rubrivivax sp.]|nr:PhzF family phenazine biosynthesis protein [Rubrivivax sp.]
MTRRFHQVDVFSEQPLQGNPLAVIHAAEGLTDPQMAALARWTNLSETSFLLPPTDPSADYRVRIWTPGGELPFAGHPTLGSCWAWLAAGGVPKNADRIVQQCGVGRVTVRRDGARLAFAAPALRRSGPLDESLLARIAAGLGLAPGEILRHAWIDNGPGWCGVLLGSGEHVRALQPDWSALGEIKLGIVGPQAAGADTAIELRALIGGGNYEDPVTGSLNASVAQWLIGDGVLPERYVAAQGHALQRAGRVHVAREDGVIWVGGAVLPVVEGIVRL